MISNNLIHYRYVDDIKIACKTLDDAKKSIINIIHSLRRKNLNLSTAKTEIWNKNDKKYEDFVKDFPIILNDVDKAVSNKNKKVIDYLLPELIKFTNSIIKIGTKFDERLFRACIWRIVKCHYFKNIQKHNLDIIARKCLKLIEDIPSRTDSFINLLVLVKNKKFVHNFIKYLLKKTVYSWVEMKLWYLLIIADKIKDYDLIKIAKKRVRNLKYPEPARNYAIIFLGKHGDYQDKEFISTILSQTDSFLTKRCILIALQDYSQKAIIYNPILNSSNDLLLISLIKYLNQLKKPIYIFENKYIGSDFAFIS